MNGKPIVCVIGAGGYVGRTMVSRLVHRGYRVRAAVHSASGIGHYASPQVSWETMDILESAATDRALRGVDTVIHLAALVDGSRSWEEHYRVNVEGTRNVWNSAASAGVRRALLCSSAAVYGLLRRADGMIGESSPANAVEPYGRTKLLAEQEALGIGGSSGMHTTVLRPVAIFGPGEHTPFGRSLRDAAVSKLLVAGGFLNKKFCYVHVDDVADAALHLMDASIPGGEVFNVAVPEPILYQDAFDAYLRALKSAGNSSPRTILLGLISRVLHASPWTAREIPRLLGERFAFRVWHPGFDLQYSSEKLCATGFSPAWTDFERILLSCMDIDRG
jgi:nucleoside-diphosphate-sugar epimerase